MPSDGERLATLEAVVAGIGADVEAMSAQIERSRARLHDLEGFAASVLALQRENRRQEERQYRRIGNAIALGGLFMAAALVALTAVTIILHTA